MRVGGGGTRRLVAGTDGAMQAMLQSLQGVLMEGWEGGSEEFRLFLFSGILEKQPQDLFGVYVLGGMFSFLQSSACIY